MRKASFYKVLDQKIGEKLGGSKEFKTWKKLAEHFGYKYISIYMRTKRLNIKPIYNGEYTTKS